MDKRILDIRKQILYINGISYQYDDIKRQKSGSYSTFYSQVEKDDYMRSLACFLMEWTDDTEYITLKTSGSTGKPKTIKAKKTYMINSAVMTLDFLSLRHLDKALLCLPMEYIAGKMMAVRALVAGLHITMISPSLNPLASVRQTFDFTALIPAQAQACITESPDIHSNPMSKIKNIIIGGGAIPTPLQQALQQYNNNIYSTYGMTETLSHIALRQLSTDKANLWYKPLQGVSVNLRRENKTLTIEAPKICEQKIFTNDIAEINSLGEFRIIGRTDNVINTAGVKIQIEEVEDKLSSLLPYPVIITYRNDDVLGQEIVLLACKTKVTDRTLLDKAVLTLPTYHRPRRIIMLESLPMTENNKPDRKKAQRIANEYPY